VEKPKRWDIGYIRSFMIYLGPVSSIFDFLTFFIMLFIFFPMFPGIPHQPLFQTAWFLESLATQTLVIFAIRTRKSPFWKSKPGKWLIVSSLIVIAAAIAIPYTILGDRYFAFVAPPPLFFVFLLGLIGAYMLLAEAVKRVFFKRHAYRIEQVLIPKRRALYISRNARLVQDIAAVICLHPEAEISFDVLQDDLSRSLSYPIDSDLVLQNLQHLRRGGLITVDWHERIIKREGSMKEYVTKRIASSEMWPLISEDWLKIYHAVNVKYGRVNEEYRDLLSPKQW
jgi:hypothetical protein